MDKGQATELLKKAYEILKTTDLATACALLEQALEADYKNEEIKHALKCVNWWLLQIRRIERFKTPYEKGSFLICQLKQYNVFLKQIDNVFEQSQYAIRYFVFSKALYFLEGLLNNQANHNDHGLMLLAGRCYKGIGNYDEALRHLEYAVSIKKEDAEILAEVADINALLSKTKTAKALFREAFFIDPLKIDLAFLESALIQNLCDEVSKLGYKDEMLNEWIPVFGFLRGVFNIKRELKPIEFGRLKQSIFTLETEYDTNPARQEILKPRLLNHYFWLMDYYEMIREEASATEQILFKIKVKDKGIFKLYTGRDEE
jgi:tetratricopeptide (TPR) repeat protein